MATPLPIYEPYIQKSYAFLYPLLGLPLRGRQSYLPAQTYLRLKGLYRQEDLKLICSYKNPPDDPTWNNYQSSQLLSHTLFENTFPTPDRMIYIFDLSPYEADIRLFLRGRYSELSPPFKKLCCTHYGVQTPEWAHIEGFLYPAKAVKRYALAFNVPEQELRGRELCPPFDVLQETLVVELPTDFVDQLPMS